MPGWIVAVRENFSVNKQTCRKQTIEIVLREFCLFSFLHLTFTALKLIQFIFYLAPGKKFSGEQ